MSKRKIARDATDGEFASKADAEANPDTHVIETIEIPDDGLDHSLDADYDKLMTRNAEVIELPDHESAEEAFVPPQPNFHTILEVWREVLKPAKTEGKKDPTPQWCTNMIGSYANLSYADCLVVRDKYFALLADMYDILLAEIDTDPDCLSYDKPEEDVENNSGHYRNLLTNWQIRFLEAELGWRCDSPTAAAEVAAMNECHKLFFGNVGLTQHLDNIRFEFTEDDQANMREALDAVLATREGDGE